MKRYRLTARAEMHGEVRDPGYVFTLEDGQKGPHRTVSPRPDGSVAAVGNAPGQMVDEPLYRELSDEENAAIDDQEAAAIAEANAHADACAARDAGQGADAEVEQVQGNPETGEVAGSVDGAAAGDSDGKPAAE